MQVPDVGFAFAPDDVRIAYQVFGEGPVAVYAPNLFTHLEVRWEHELVRRMFERMAANLRVVLFDHRGSGLSDGFDQAPLLERRAHDISAVMDACGVGRASVIDHSAGAQVAAAFAVEHPERTDRLVMANGRVGRSVELDGAGSDADTTTSLAATLFEHRLAGADSFGTEPGEDIVLTSPSAAAHPDYVQWLIRARRHVGTRDAYRRQVESIVELDIIDVAPRIRAPTMIRGIMEPLADRRLAPVACVTPRRGTRATERSGELTP